MKKQISSLSPYVFSSDFAAPEPKTEDTISVRIEDIAALLADTRESTAALVRDDTLKAAAEQLRDTSTDLRRALATIVDLAAHLETAAIDEYDRQTALASVRKLAATLIDHQGDLFAE